MKRNIDKISVIGLGYIGLPTAAMFASRKVKVIGVDVNQSAVDTINRGEIHIVEPDLDIAVHSAVREGYLRATTEPAPADAFLIAVPTPFKGENHEPDLSYIEAATKAIAPVLAKGNLVILESTSPVGATEAMAGWLAEARPDLRFPQGFGEDADVNVAHCPERVLPGKVMRELITNDRVIGGMTPACAAKAADLYRLFVTGDCVIASGPRVAEMAKLTENSFRDVNIAFANELSLISDDLGIDVWELIALANRHPRVDILRPGPGVGGHCIAVDPWFIVSGAPDKAKLIATARNVNEGKPDWVVEKVRELVSVSRADPVRIACFGLAFKPDIDDLRESPAIEICEKLAAMSGVEVVAVEPNIEQIPAKLAEKGVRLADADAAIYSADIVVGLVAHSQFAKIERSALGNAIIVDTCAIWQER